MEKDRFSIEKKKKEKGKYEKSKIEQYYFWIKLQKVRDRKPPIKPESKVHVKTEWFYKWIHVFG